MTTTADTLPVLLPGVPVLARGDSGVHVGCDPRSAVVLPVRSGADARALADVLVSLRTPCAYRQVSRRVRSAGLDAPSFRAMLDRLVAAGKATPATDAPPMRVDVHGHGDVGSLLTASLAAAGHDVVQGFDDPRPRTLFVVADQPVPDPALTAHLMACGVPHLAVHVRDGLGVIGPLVLPGSTSCLRCVDLARSDLDPQWPALAARLTGVSGYASAAVVRATVAIAHAQVDEITETLRVDGSPEPSLVGRTMEFHASPPRLISGVAAVHDRCGCVRRGFAQD